MRIAIRADASVSIGTGHVMRCLTLADALRDAGGTVLFLCRPLPGNMLGQIEQRGFETLALDAEASLQHEDSGRASQALARRNWTAEWLIVDHYDLGAAWESALRDHARKILVIDDLADRRHDCDALLDQNYYVDMERRYDKLVPSSCRLFLGPSHALLREEFRLARRTMRRRDGTVRRILVFFGGSDPTNETEKALDAFRLLDRPDLHVDVVVGGANPQRTRIEQLCRALPNVEFHCQASNMAGLMADADLALGAGGTTTWERCFLGLPALTVVVADNQRETTKALADDGVIWNLGPASATSAQSMRAALEEALSDPAKLREKSAASLRIMGRDPAPGAAKLAQYMFAECRDTAHNAS